MGRLVITHSTYLDGLIQILKLLAKEDKIKTIVPGVISKVKGRSKRLIIRISYPVKGGYKLIARKGSGFQEVFVLTELDIEEFRSKINKLLK